MENYYSVFIEGRTINKFVAEGNLSNQSPPSHTHTHQKKREYNRQSILSPSQKVCLLLGRFWKAPLNYERDIQSTELDQKSEPGN